MWYDAKDIIVRRVELHHRGCEADGRVDFSTGSRCTSALEQRPDRPLASPCSRADCRVHHAILQAGCRPAIRQREGPDVPRASRRLGSKRIPLHSAHTERTGSDKRGGTRTVQERHGGRGRGEAHLMRGCFVASRTAHARNDQVGSC